MKMKFLAATILVLSAGSAFAGDGKIAYTSKLLDGAKQNANFVCKEQDNSDACRYAIEGALFMLRPEVVEQYKASFKEKAGVRIQDFALILAYTLIETNYGRSGSISHTLQETEKALTAGLQPWGNDDLIVGFDPKDGAIVSRGGESYYAPYSY